LLPNFLLIGTAKGGTNALHNYLRAHPDIFMPETKELKFFSNEEVWSKGIDWYEGLFPEGYALRGEGSVQYTMYPNFPNVPQRIQDHIPEARFIYLMRDPVDRMRSQFRHLVAIGWEHEPIEKALVRDWPSLEPFRRPEEKALYIHYSMYAMQLEKYFEIFDRDRFLLLTSEALQYDRAATMRKVLSFLSLDPEWTAPVIEREFHKGADRSTLRNPELQAKIQKIPGYRALTRVTPQRVKRFFAPVIVRKTDPGEQAIEISDSFRTELEDLLRPDVAKLRGFMDTDFDGWGIA